MSLEAQRWQQLKDEWNKHAAICYAKCCILLFVMCNGVLENEMRMSNERMFSRKQKMSEFCLCGSYDKCPHERILLHDLRSNQF
jgi:hypothetical protein